MEIKVEEPIVLVVHVLKALGHNRKMAGWEYRSAPPHVRRFVTGTFSEVTAELATNGYTYSVEVDEEDVPLLDFAARV
jgi:hypothetical protein